MRGLEQALEHVAWDLTDDIQRELQERLEQQKQLAVRFLPKGRDLQLRIR